MGGTKSKSPTVWNSLPETVIFDLFVTGTFNNRPKFALYMQ